MNLIFYFFVFALSIGSLYWLNSPQKIPNYSLELPLIETDSISITRSARKLGLAPMEKSTGKEVSSFGKTNLPFRKEPKNILDNWRLEGSGILASEVAPFLAKSQPESIVYFSDAGMRRILPNRLEQGTAQSDQTLFLGSATSIKRTKEEREMRAAANAHFSQRSQNTPLLRTLSSNAYEIVFFHPGNRDNGETLSPIAGNLLAALQGPDYSLADFDWRDEQKMQSNLSTILPLGHTGEILLQVKYRGFILDDPGFDFSLFENAFRIGSSMNTMQEFCAVGVSEQFNPNSFRWFSCDPRNGILRGCLGAVPTHEGGDRFDLAELGIQKIRYIWIKDLGISKNYFSKWPTEGCDLDALRFDHVYRND